MGDGDGSQEKFPGRLIKRVREVVAGTEVKVLPILIEISPAAGYALHELISKPNPTLAEIPFLGIGEGSLIEEIVSPESYSDSSILRPEGRIFMQHVDEEQLERLFNFNAGRLKKILVLGHTHPAGSAVIAGVRYIVQPSDFPSNPLNGSWNP